LNCAYGSSTVVSMIRPDMERPLSNVIFTFYFIFLFMTLNAPAASTMNQSDIRGLAFRPEPTVIFSVARFAFYEREFNSSKTSLSHRSSASSFVVPTLLSINYSLIKSYKQLRSRADEKYISSRTVYSFSCLVLRNCKPYKARQFSGNCNVCLAWHLTVINQMSMTFS
jgi:hypothetical protein